MGKRKGAANELPAGSIPDLAAEPEAGGEINVDHFMGEAAEEDRQGAKAKHIDDGLDSVAEMVDRMRKGVAYAKAVHDLDVKLAVLNEVADTAAAVRDDARRAVRNASAEKRNLQPS